VTRAEARSPGGSGKTPGLTPLKSVSGKGPTSGVAFPPGHELVRDQPRSDVLQRRVVWNEIV